MKRFLVKTAAIVLIVNTLAGNAFAADICNFTQKTKATNTAFCDVSPSQWYYNEVKKCSKLGLMSGKSANAFDPKGCVTIAEAIAMACRVNSIYNGGSGNIPNTGTNWYDGCVDYAISKGIITENQFPNCNKPATRGELACILSKALPKTELDSINKVTSLPDVTKSTPYCSNIYLLYNAGILTGCDAKGSCKPSATINRAEACTIMNRLAVPAERKKVYTQTPTNTNTNTNTTTTPAPTTTPTTTTPAPTTTPTTTTPAPTTTPATTPTPTTTNVSDYAQQVVNLVNAERKKVGLSPLSIVSTATTAAQVRAKEIQTSFSHTRPDGTTCFTALKQAGASYRTAGENIAYGQRTPQEVMTAWMNSPGHKANILKADFTGIGVGVYKSQNGTMYWSQEFIG